MELATDRVRLVICLAILARLTHASYRWRVNGTDQFFRCLMPQHCEGGLNSRCATHRVGPLCAQCEKNYQPNAQTSKCELCPEQNTSIGVSAVVVFAIIVVLVVMYYIVLRSGRELADAAKARDQKKFEWEVFNPDDMILHGYLPKDETSGGEGGFNPLLVALRTSAVAELSPETRSKPDFTCTLRAFLVVTNLCLQSR